MPSLCWVTKHSLLSEIGRKNPGVHILLPNLEQYKRLFCHRNPSERVVKLLRIFVVEIVLRQKSRQFLHQFIPNPGFRRKYKFMIFLSLDLTEDILMTSSTPQGYPWIQWHPKRTASTEWCLMNAWGNSQVKVLSLSIKHLRQKHAKMWKKRSRFPQQP